MKKSHPIIEAIPFAVAATAIALIVYGFWSGSWRAFVIGALVAWIVSKM